MNRWLSVQLAPLLHGTGGPVVVLDPDGVLASHDLDAIAKIAETARVSDWVELRRHWDLDLRRRADVATVVIIVTGTEFRAQNDLPWDIEDEASAVVRIRWPIPEQLRPLFHAAPAYADALVDVAGTGTPESAAGAAFGIAQGDSSAELAAIARLRLTSGIPDELWPLLTTWFVSPIARAIAEAGGSLDPLQSAWGEWLDSGSLAGAATELKAAPGPIISLLTSGLLESAAAKADGLPTWTRLGAREPDPETILRELLDHPPEQAVTLDGWIEIASWWGQTRATIAVSPVPPPIAEEAWAKWASLDLTFNAWLRERYGTTLLGAASTPRALHQVADFLARHVRDGRRVLLVVIDGLGFTQWHTLRVATDLHVAQAGGCLAMLPTLTSVSRQAIFAGTLPSDFSETITSTRYEATRWADFWSEQGIDSRDVGYERTLGGDTTDIPSLKGRVMAVVVNAIDELLHGAEVLGDRQVDVGVQLWANAGFLRTLVEQAADVGFVTWITSDHGNLETLPSHRPREGQLVESAGMRVRMYPNKLLRDAAEEYGIAWDPPGYPQESAPPLFARGRSGFHSTGIRVTHGGMSFDEVIVPFVQVTP